MRIINDIIFVDVDDLVFAANTTEGYIYKAVSDKNSTLSHIHIKYKGKLYFPFKELSQRYQNLVLEKFGDPVQYLQKEPIKALVKKSLDAKIFYRRTKDWSLFP